MNAVVLVGAVTDVAASASDYELKLSTGEAEPLTVLVSKDEVGLEALRPGEFVAIKGKVAMQQMPVNGAVIPVPAVRCERGGFVPIRGSELNREASPVMQVERPPQTEGQNVAPSASPQPSVPPSPSPDLSPPAAPSPAPSSPPVAATPQPATPVPGPPAAAPSLGAVPAAPVPGGVPSIGSPVPPAPGGSIQPQPAPERSAAPLPPADLPAAAPPFNGPVTAQPVSHAPSGGLGGLTKAVRNHQESQPEEQPQGTDERADQPLGPDKMDAGIPF